MAATFPIARLIRLPPSRPASFKGWAVLLEALHRDRLCQTTQSYIGAEAERKRGHHRSEAEAILTREAQQRKVIEECVLAMMERRSHHLHLELKQCLERPSDASSANYIERKGEE